MSAEATRTLARFAAALTYEAIPGSAREHARRLLLDALACAIAGDRGEETHQVAALAAALGHSEEAGVIGGGRLSLAGATLLNGYLITAVTMCDVHRPTLTHITPEVVPPALAIAERDELSGRDLLVALVAGCETATRVGLGWNFPRARERGWHGPGIIGPFGGAAAAGRLLGLDVDAMARAFGLAGSQAAGTFAAWGTPTVKFHQCRGALSGLMAALLAQQQFVATREFLTARDGGLFSAYSDGGRPDAVIADLGQRWELEQIALRPWPCASGIQGVATAMFDVLEREQIGIDDVERVAIELPESVHAMHGIFPRYRGKFEALLSVHYVVAAVLADRALTLAQFEPQRYDDPRLRAFAAERVEVCANTAMSGSQAAATVRTRDGQTIAVRCEHTRGSPGNPLGSREVAGKFRVYAQGRIDPARSEQIIDMVWRLEELRSVAPLLDLLHSTPASPQRS